MGGKLAEFVSQCFAFFFLFSHFFANDLQSIFCWLFFWDLFCFLWHFFFFKLSFFCFFFFCLFFCSQNFRYFFCIFRFAFFIYGSQFVCLFFNFANFPTSVLYVLYFNTCMEDSMHQRS